MHDALQEEQSKHYLSVAAQAEMYWSWNQGSDSFILEPFGRWDPHDEQRSHWDLRQAAWLHYSDTWEIRLGIRQEFWGVTEFNHLVDVINQSDAVEDMDGEAKLGQPMLNASLQQDWGVLDVYLLTGFRERNFAGPKGRPNLALPVLDKALYESSAGQEHLVWLCVGVTVFLFMILV